jgi:centromeric protein E
MQETIILLRQQLDSLAERQSTQQIAGDESSGKNIHNRNGEESEIYSGAGTPTSVMSLNRVFAQEETKEIYNETALNSQVSFPYKICSFIHLPDTPNHCDEHFWGFCLHH